MLEGGSVPSRLSHPPLFSFQKTHLGPSDPLDLNKTSKKNMKLTLFRFLVPRRYPESSVISHQGRPFVGFQK